MKKEIIYIAVIAFLAVGVYLNSVKGDFLWDDAHLIVENRHIKEGVKIRDIFTEDVRGVRGARSYFYRPLQNLTFALDYGLYGLDPRGYHITNILLHVSACVLVFLLVKALFADALLSFLTGLFFAVHPAHTEAVAYISGRADPLAAVFLLAAFIFYVLSDKTQGDKDARIRVIAAAPATAGFYILALLSRESALVFPLLIPVYHAAFQKKIDIKRLLPVLTISAVYVIIRLTLLGHLLPRTQAHGAFWQRVPGFFAALTNYLKILIVPLGLHMDYGDRVFSMAGPEAILGLFIFMFFVFLALKKRRDNRVFAFSVFWFFAALLPHANIYPVNAYMAEHWLYLPSIGFFLLLATTVLSLRAPLSGAKQPKLGLLRRFAPRNDGLAIIAGLIFIIFFGYLTVRQNHYWADPQRLYERTVRLAPHSSTAHNNLAVIYGKKGRMDEAERLLRKALEADPENAGAMVNLGVVYRSRGMTEKAIGMYKRALKTAPRSVKALYNLGNAYYGAGRYSEAVRAYGQVMEIEPGYRSVKANLEAARSALRQRGRP